MIYVEKSCINLTYYKGMNIHEIDVKKYDHQSILNKHIWRVTFMYVLLILY